MNDSASLTLLGLSIRNEWAFIIYHLNASRENLVPDLDINENKTPNIDMNNDITRLLLKSEEEGLGIAIVLITSSPYTIIPPAKTLRITSLDGPRGKRVMPKERSKPLPAVN